MGRWRFNKTLNINIHSGIQVLTVQDFLGIIDALMIFRFYYKHLPLDNIDDFSNKRVRLVGELLQEQIRVGLLRIEKTVKYNFANKLKSIIHATPLTLLLNTEAIDYAIQEFFVYSPLSQFLDQINPLSSVTHKRKLTFGGGGNHVNILLRDVNPSQYHKLCSIETPEGSKVGLVGSLATYARINSFGFIEAPYYKIIKGRIESFLPIYLNASQEFYHRVAFGNIKIGIRGEILTSFVNIVFKRELFKIPAKNVDYLAPSALGIFAVGGITVPCLQHNDGVRVLMASAHQRQSVPLLYPRRPLISTGVESVIARDSGMGIVSSINGKVVAIGNGKIAIKDKNRTLFRFFLSIYNRTNQGTVIHQRPCVSINQKVVAGQVIADGSAMNRGGLAVGQNIIVAYMPWDGYNFEDALIVNERLVYDQIFSSLHIKRFRLKIRGPQYLPKKLGPEIITRKLPDINEKLLKHLDNNGVIKIGTLVKGGDILVGKLTPVAKPTKIKSGTEKLIDAIFKRPKRPPKFLDTSLKLPSDMSGRVIDVKVFAKSKVKLQSIIDSTEIKKRIIEKVLTEVTGVIIFIAEISNLEVGDKMTGRHGNKGVIAKIVPRENMPYLPDGTPVDMLINPLGVPSRMNVGQIYEGLMGLAAKTLNVRYRTPNFARYYGPVPYYAIANCKLKEASEFKNWLFSELHPGKIMLYDGRTGQAFGNPIIVCCSYMLKLIHQVEHKLHARSIGPYSIITQQPLRGRSKAGGQRVGEMEVWAFQAYGAAYTLRELLTIKSDDLIGRSNAHVAIIKGFRIPSPAVPETFKVLIRELQSLCLDIATYKLDDKDSYSRVDVIK